jgi:hypothetical protein
LTDHQLDAVAKESAGEYGVLNFAGSLKKVPGDLIFNQYRCRMFSHDCETLRGCICSGTSLRYRGHRVLAPGLKTEGAAMSNDDHKPMTEDQARKYRIKASGFRKTSTSMNPGRVSVSRWSRVFLANSTDVSRCCRMNRKVRPSTSKYRWTRSIITNDRLFPAFSGGYRDRSELRRHRFRSLSAHGVRIPPL